jgi:hypothetical protein
MVIVFIEKLCTYLFVCRVREANDIEDLTFDDGDRRINGSTISIGQV